MQNSTFNFAKKKKKKNPHLKNTRTELKNSIERFNRRLDLEGE